MKRETYSGLRVSVADSPQRLSTGLLRLCRYLLLHTADFAIELERRLGRPVARRAPGPQAAAVAEGGELTLLA
jgi:hypothetical protein